MDKRDFVEINDTYIFFRNFAGKEGPYNRAGDRNFCVAIPVEQAREMEQEGWNIKWREPREEGDELKAHIKVSIRFDIFPPTVYQVTSNRKVRLNEKTIENLDWADILNVDLALRPYHWEVNGTKGIKAYVKSMYVVIDEDGFADKYSDIPSDEDYDED